MLSIAFVISALGAMNGSILTNARVPFAMARDGLFFSKLGEVSHSTRVPVIAILVQGAFACLLAVSGSFDQLTDYVVFASWIFYAAATASLFVFRRRHAHKRAGSVFRTPGYPLVPLVFVAVSALLLLNTLVTAPWESGIGLVFIAAGVPVYFLFRRRRVSKNNA
jgi:APA family basic amino acid/polyamine antiporter